MLKTLDRLSEMKEALSVTTITLTQQRQARLKRREDTSLASHISTAMVSNSSSLTHKASLIKQSSGFSTGNGHVGPYRKNLPSHENDLISEVPAEP